LEKIKTNILRSVTFFLSPENRAAHEIMSKKYGRPGQASDDVIWRMRIACWIPKATGTHAEYAILIAFPRQQWLRQHAWMLRPDCLV